MGLNSWYLLTGGPSSGKTTLIGELAKLGYCIIPEASKALIDEGKAAGKTPEDVRQDEVYFTKIVLARRLEDITSAPRDQIVFFDRGLVDSVAYDYFYGAEPSPEIVQMARSLYRRVFFLEQVKYDIKEFRVENEDTAISLGACLRDTSQQLGYALVILPKISVEERLKLVLRNL